MQVRPYATVLEGSLRSPYRVQHRPLICDLFFAPFLVSSLFLVQLTMPTPFERLFGPTGTLGPNWLGSANVPFSPTTLHHLVVSTNLVEAAQARSAYGHWSTKTLCKSDSMLQYWKAPRNLPIYLHDKTQALNPPELAPLEACLAMLRAEPVFTSHHS
jgi:hypothetical protein